MMSLFFGNSVEYMKTCVDNTFDACITDFPYRLTRASWDTWKTHGDFLEDLKTWIFQINRVTKNKLLITTSNQPFTTDLINANRRYWKDELVWDKVRTSGPLNAKKRPLRRHETIQVFYEKSPHYTTQYTYGHTPYTQKSNAAKTSSLYGKQTPFVVESQGERFPSTLLQMQDCRRTPHYHFKKDSVVSFTKIRGKHATKKPEELYRWIIRSYTKPHDLILDPFAGECTTGFAAHSEERDSVMCELDPIHYSWGEQGCRERGIAFQEITL